MPLSNLLSFHHRVTLQNASAFPVEHYAALNNLHCVNAALRPLAQNTHLRQNRPTAHPSPSPVRAALPTQQNIQHHTLQPLATQVIHPADSSTALKTSAITTQKTALPKTEPILPARAQSPARTPSITGSTNKNSIWKPGRGSIEKVDKLSGEIMHLAEACI